MFESQYQAQLLRIEDLYRDAAEERRARFAVAGRLPRRTGKEHEGRVRRHVIRRTRVA